MKHPGMLSVRGCHLLVAKGRNLKIRMNIVVQMCSVLLLIACCSGVRRKFSWGGFIQWQRVVICICCALFVTSQFDLIVLFPNQRFSQVR